MMLNSQTWTWAVPLLASALALAGVILTLYLQNRNFHRQIRATHTLKIAEMRQAWINSLRDAMSVFQSWAVTPDLDHTEKREFYEAGTKIELFMNPEDEDYEALQHVMYEFLGAADPGEKYAANPKYVEVCQRILKREWETLKSEIHSAGK
ncbi:MAG: hypothetical protein K2X59_00510 [Sphingomonas sp.]|nr:hypothetical protein [Sphingomonas sp.]